MRRRLLHLKRSIIFLCKKVVRPPEECRGDWRAGQANLFIE